MTSSGATSPGHPAAPGAHRRSSQDRQATKLLGRRLVNDTFVLLKTAYLHAHHNDALLQPLARIESTLTETLTHTGAPRAKLSVTDDGFFLNNLLVPMLREAYLNAEFLKVIFGELEIGEVEYNEGCGEQDFRMFMAAVTNAVRAGPAGRESLRPEQGKITLKPPPEEKEEVALDRRQFILRVYATAVAFTSTVVWQWQVQARPPQTSEIKRMVQKLFAIVDMDAVTVLGLSQLRACSDNLASHFVHVTLLSLLMARKLKLSRGECVGVGMTAFKHELGAVDLPPELVARIDTPGHAETALLAKLPALSVARGLECGTPSAASISRIASIYENRGHIPEPFQYSDPSLPACPMAELIAVADAYDHLTTSRMGRPALLPDEALQTLATDSSRRFGQWAVELLADTVGRYPVGALVQLSNGDLGIVFGLPESAHSAARPRVRLITGTRNGAVVDLRQRLPDGRYALSIRCCRSPEAHTVNVPHFFLD